MSIGIYKITSPSDKIYIGQSTNIEKRFKQYEKFKNIKNQIGLYNSFLKYGVINHKFEIIEECKSEELNIRERYWQDYYNVLEEGLNCVLTNTNELPRIMSEKTKQKISESRKGIKFSQDIKNKISRNKTGLYRIDDDIIKEIIELYKEKKSTSYISEITKISITQIIIILKRENIYKLSNHKPSILQYGLDGKFIKEWDNISLICRELKLTGKNGDIQQCCEKNQSSAFKFQWKYKTENYPIVIPPYMGRYKPILQYDLEGNFIKEWSSIKEALSQLGGDIHGCLKGRIKKTSSGVWKYK